MPTATTSSRIPHAAAEASHVVPDHKSVDRREGQKKPLDSPNNDPKTVSWLRPKSSANAVISCAGSQEQTAAGRSGSAGRLAVAQKRRTANWDSTIRPMRDRKSTRLNSSHLGISY